MFICKVQGKCVSTIKSAGLAGNSLIMVRRVNKAGNVAGDLMVAADTIGCSAGALVLVTQGKGARIALGNENSPADLAVVGIVDSCDFEK